MKFKNTSNLSKHSGRDLRQIAFHALNSLKPTALLQNLPSGKQIFDTQSGGKAAARTSAVLCLGKAAPATWEALQKLHPSWVTELGAELVIGPVQPKAVGRRRRSGGVDSSDPRPTVPHSEIIAEFAHLSAEHPIPGKGSLRAGRALIEFFASLPDREINRLEIFLSGGASSLLWLPPAEYDLTRLQSEVTALYRAGYSIEKLNRLRSKLCALKSGGAGRWLRRLAPRIQAHVHVISDVAPFPLSVVGSGPFWDGEIKHSVMADNASWVNGVAKHAQHLGINVMEARAGMAGDWEQWIEDADAILQSALARGKSGLILLGGEATIEVKIGAGLSRKTAPRGGRLSHISAALALRWSQLLSEDWIELVALSSDGLDGGSNSAGTVIDVTQSRLLRNPAAHDRLQRALAQFDSATELKRWGALIPAHPTGTNVQDLIAIRVKKNG